MNVHIRCTLYFDCSTTTQELGKLHASVQHICAQLFGVESWGCCEFYSRPSKVITFFYRRLLSTKKHMHCIYAILQINFDAMPVWHGHMAFPTIASLSYRQLKTAKRPSQAMKRNSSCDQSALVQVSCNKSTIARLIFHFWVGDEPQPNPHLQSPVNCSD